MISSRLKSSKLLLRNILKNSLYGNRERIKYRFSPVEDVQHPVEHSEDFTALQVPAANLGHKYHLHVDSDGGRCLKKQKKIDL